MKGEHIFKETNINMKIRCVKCEKVKELDSSELKEAGEFVEKRKLRAVGFLKVLSLDLRDVCTNGKEHVWEFDPGFDKEVHDLAKEINITKGIMTSSEEEEAECINIIDEATARKEAATQRIIENGEKKKKLLEDMKTIAWIPDESLWS